ncbi:MAG: type II toxin-antitoxin system VapC family toxin, partial [Jiangellaceae bacterium]
MIAVDTNILVYAHRRDSEFHDAARDVVAGLAQGQGAWAVPWPCIHELLAIVTHARIYDPPSTTAEAVEQVDAWTESPSLVLIGESIGHWSTLRSLVLAGRIRGPVIHDARVAAICKSQGVRELWSADRDFSRFAELNVRN